MLHKDTVTFYQSGQLSAPVSLDLFISLYEVKYSLPQTHLKKSLPKVLRFPLF